MFSSVELKFIEWEEYSQELQEDVENHIVSNFVLKQDTELKEKHALIVAEEFLQM